MAIAMPAQAEIHKTLKVDARLCGHDNFRAKILIPR
jgi:hypothetical protein